MTNDLGRWDWARISSVLPDCVLNHIAVVLLPCSNAGTDQLSWNWSTNGLFSSIATYKNLITHCTINSSTNWKLIWNCKAPQRVRVFLWLLWQDRILADRNRVHCHMFDDGHCVRCRQPLETSNSVSNTFFSTNSHLWLTKKLDSHEVLSANGKNWSTQFAILCWLLWKCPNNFIFNNSHSNVDVIVDTSLI